MQLVFTRRSNCISLKHRWDTWRYYIEYNALAPKAVCVCLLRFPRISFSNGRSPEIKTQTISWKVNDDMQIPPTRDRVLGPDSI